MHYIILIFFPNNRGLDMFDFGLSVIKNISTFGVIYTRLMLKLESDEKNYIRQENIPLFYFFK